MNNLYVFAIGGSGERVMHSLLMLLAAGMPVGAKAVIPVFVDNDENSNALDKCKKLISYYRSTPAKDKNVGMHSLYKDLGENIPSFAHVNIDEPRLLNVAGAAIGNLRQIIGEVNKDDSVERVIGEERDLLFTQDDLEMPLDVGFVGNPNIGTVVLNSLSFQVDEFTSIKGGISNNDGVIVIGSLFGGTGAAGFPLIINKFFTTDNTHKPLLGGVAVLPYFTLTDEDKTNGDVAIDVNTYNVKAETFDTKTRAALMYYADYMENMDYRYYVGDDHRRQYEHYVGGGKQANPTSLIEVMAAMSVIDFSKQSKPNDIVYKRPQWSFINGDVDSNVNGILNPAMRRALVKFQMMKILFTENCFLKDDISQSRIHVANIGFNEDHRMAIIKPELTKNFPSAWGLSHIFQEWDTWIKELKDPNAKRKLLLFDTDQTITTSNLTKLFFSQHEFGIAKVETRHEGGFFFFGGEEVQRPADPDVADLLGKAYNVLYPKGKKDDANNISDDQRLGKLLQIISIALDKVIDEKCAL